ncbi:ferric-dicitrate binding protein FerR (iron transport regulator) [Dyadobacter jejuensis]|uniref:Ferric-dicitrate binding protein FerR (Iron transport regulator) n=1 Tax=Dyadobacter jejuensis TaxID=1082580 RepID=A0A316AE60_9BACT|nr:FecR domain-containing protein [Dyadobacter jejuensis]PWJ55911.1 ferric-dicitrate binding protein FerR (iron transport regulator) [Dyadobacter jejuensis]
MSESEINAEIVKKYITDKASPDEMKVFFYLLKEGKLDGELRKHMDSEIKNGLMDIEKKEIKTVQKKYAWDWRIAASILLLIGAGFLTYLNPSWLPWRNSEINFSYIATGRSEIKKIILSDGSIVWLNASSKLRYPVQFEKAKRELFLEEGEAYFEIERDEKKPMVVFAAGTETKVLGTKFNIRSYNFLPSVQITVTNGKVSVSTKSINEQNTLHLLPNQRASFNRLDALTFQDSIHAENALGWKQGRMIFDNESLKDVVAELQQKYNTPIEFEKSGLQNIRLSAEFESKDSLPDVLEALSLANNLEYELENGKVLLKSVK